MIGNPLLLGGGDYEISRSVRLRSSASAYFNRTPGSSGTRTKATISAWSKRGSLGARNPIAVLRQGATDYFILEFQSDDTLQVISVTSSSVNTQLVTTQVFRDPSAWYHIVFTYDSTVASPGSSSIYLSVNGVKVTALSTATYPSQNTNLYFNVGSVDHTIGRLGNLTTYADCYLTEINSIDGQALTPSSFGETDAVTGVWKPKKYTGTYGTNGFYLNFSDNSNNTATTIGKDYSGNGNNWTPNNISVTSGATYDSMLDVPTPWADGGNGRGNYCVWNPIEGGNGSITFSRANLQLTHSNSTSQVARGTFSLQSGKWYWEVTATTSTGCGIGIVDQANANNALGSGVFLYGHTSGNSYNNGSFITYGASYADGDVIGVALDKDANTLTFYKNGVSQGTFTSSLTSSPYQPAFSRITGTPVCDANFGQRPFSYTPPSGFKALNTGNLPEPTIKKGNAYFDVVTRSGTSANTAVSGLGFQPDFVWVKNRNSTGWHNLYDAVRGATKALTTNGTDTEYTYNGLSSFDASGYSITGAGGDINLSGRTYVDWVWKEGATPGFDIVTYTGTNVTMTVNHSLGVAPRMMIVKRRNSTGDWGVYHASLGANGAVFLNLTDAYSTPGPWNNTAPTSTQFTIATGSFLNVNGGTYVAYLFSEVAGFSKFGSYTGNGSADGPFVFCGFRPRWLMVKCSSAGSTNWVILDTARDPINAQGNLLRANLSDAEASFSPYVDALSNGFKIRTNDAGVNTSSQTYIYAAFAENPQKYSLAR